ncbi:hypothetical protein MJN54_29140, partial [Salmonella enterica subsp. enterica serovar Kentucky]|nr:hypothetical protein [Salmonella enterica subsp. enterica serovar Kentucky]
KVVIVPVEGRFQEARLMDMNHDLTLSGWATDSNDPDSFFRPLLFRSDHVCGYCRGLLFRLKICSPCCFIHQTSKSVNVNINNSHIAEG